MVPAGFDDRLGSSVAAFALGIDIGGTFTDIVAFDAATGRQFNRKLLTTHDDPANAVIEGICAMIEAGELPATETARVVHATTLFTNALIERRGAETGLITTEGFRDALEIGRERKYGLYDIAIKKPEPLVPRDWRLEAHERLDATGHVRIPLDEGSIRDAAQALVDGGVESVAIIFLHTYLNDTHERRAAEVIQQRFPDLSVTISSEVAPEIREFERASTTAANAYIKPMAESYLQSLTDKISDTGITAPLHLMISSGGLTNVAEARRQPVQMLESGPAAGALSGAHFGRDDVDGKLLAFDMGGTTAKLCLVDGGEPMIAYGFEAGRQERFVEGSGLPIRISTIELIEIGAGGGSIANVDDLGFLKVGPRSAGSEPGPAAYGLGGREATVTDADFQLGYLNPGYFAGGMLDVDMAAAGQALDRVAEKAGLNRTEIAWGIHDIVNENMASAARVHIAERGRDPRDYALLSTGGAGPVHAYFVAKKLGLRKLICPRAAGVASALGLLVAPGRVDRVATVGAKLADCDLEELETSFQSLETDARAVIAETGLDPKSVTFQRRADGRYTGQGFELVVPLPDGPYNKGDSANQRARLLAAFESAYTEKFSRTPLDVPVEFINIRLTARAPVPGGAQLRTAADIGAAQDPRKGERPAYFPENGDYVTAPVFERNRLVPGERYEGPAIIEEQGSTLIIGPRAIWQVAQNGNLIVDLPEPEEAP